MKKKLLSLFLALTLALSLAAPAWAATPEEAQDSAQLLYNLGLFQGSGTNEDGSPRFALERAPPRAEAVTILVRLLGAEEAAQAQTWTTPFTDVPDWAQSYVGYAYAKGYTTGVEPMSHVFPVKNVLREDEGKPSSPRQALLANAPAPDEAAFLVPKAVE